MDAIIRGGTVVTAFETFKADIGIAGGKIIQLGRSLEGTASLELDAADRYVFPGLVDSSVSFTVGPDGVCPADDFKAGTAAAAAGGITTVINQVWCSGGESAPEALSRTLEEAAGQSRVDFSFHAMMEPGPALRQDVLDLVFSGIPSLVLAGPRGGEPTGYDGALFSLLREAARYGALVGVFPENRDVIDCMTRMYLAEGKVSPDYLGRAWPAFIEQESAAKAAVFAQAASAHMHVFGLSAAAGLQEIEKARIKGVQLTCETHPYYLLLTADRMYHDRDGALFITAPPLREDRDVTRLWLGLRTGAIRVVSSGHRGLWRSQKTEPPSFAAIPPGLGCCESMLPLLFSEGVSRNLISLERLVELVSYNPACLFGLYPEKGTVAVGADADLVIFDPHRNSTITSGSRQAKSDISPFGGWELTGMVEATMLRGRLAYHRGEIVSEPGTGRFLKRIPLE